MAKVIEFYIPNRFSEKSGFSSPAKTREGNRVLRTSKEVGLGTRNTPETFVQGARGGRALADRLAED